jgi:membrane fusion protein (multidrug efflux system)
MKFRQISIVLGGIVIVGGFLLNNYLASLKKEPEKTGETGMVPTVLTKRYTEDTVQSIIQSTGRLVALESIQVISEVQGKYSLSAKDFREGQAFNEGEVLINIAPAEMAMNLKAQKSSFLNALIQLLPDLKLDFPNEAETWEKYIEAFDVSESLAELPEAGNKKLKIFLNSRNIYTNYYNLKASEITLSKYQIRAPFNGVVSSSIVNPGMIIRPGQVLGSFINPNLFELELALPESDMKLISVGDKAICTDRATGKKYQGKVIRKAKFVDQNTQTSKVFARLEGEDLKEGMYIEVAIEARQLPSSMIIDRKLLLDASSLFVVKDEQLKLKEVKIQRLGPNTAIIQGLENGDLILDQSLNGAYEGMKVQTISK